MIRVQIGGNERDLDDVSPQWVNEQINRRRADGVPVCVKVLVNSSAVNIALATPGCQSEGGGRQPSQQEKELFDLWEQLHLNTDEFTGGKLIAFLRQLS